MFAAALTLFISVQVFFIWKSEHMGTHATLIGAWWSTPRETEK